VKEGNNLTKLAEQYGTSIADIKAANPDLKDENIKIGQKLNIPKKGQHPAAVAQGSKHAADKQVATEHNTGKKGKQAEPENKNKRTGKQLTAKEKKARAAEEAKKAAEEAAKKKAAEEARRKAAEEAKKPISHEVKEGNNLTKLAAQYGVSPDEIRKANNIKGDNIRIGQKLIIPKKHGAKQNHQEQQPKTQQQVTSKQAKSQAKQPAKQAAKANSTVTPKKSSRKK